MTTRYKLQEARPGDELMSVKLMINGENGKCHENQAGIRISTIFNRGAEPRRLNNGNV